MKPKDHYIIVYWDFDGAPDGCGYYIDKKVKTCYDGKKYVPLTREAALQDAEHDYKDGEGRWVGVAVYANEELVKVFGLEATTPFPKKLSHSEIVEKLSKKHCKRLRWSPSCICHGCIMAIMLAGQYDQS